MKHKRLHSFKSRILAGSAIAVAASSLCALFAPLVYAGSDTKTQKSEEKTAAKLSGQDLYAINCNRCHSERYPTEWTPSHWKTVLTHMRVRANLPASQAREILKYLQEESSN